LHGHLEVGQGLALIAQVEREAASESGQVPGDHGQPLAAGHRQGAVQEPGHVPEVL
jgi:hypothetical protein